LSISSKRPQRRLVEVITQAFEGLQANYCRNPSRQNFGVPPRHLDRRPRPRRRAALRQGQGL